MRPATRRSLAADLRALGLRAGDTVMVHAGVRSVGPIVGGVNTLVQSVLDAIGLDGTLLCYVDWETGFDEYAEEPSLVDEVPVFDKRTAKASRDFGIFPETVRTWPGAVRSDNPDAGSVAIGSRAAWLCADHPLSYGYGEGSPFAKLVEIDARILSIGAPLDTLTILHHAEHCARVEGKRVKCYRRKLLVDGEPTWVDIEEFDTADPVVEGMPEDHFGLIAQAALDAGFGSCGRVGAAASFLVGAAALHRIGVYWLESWPKSPILTGPAGW